MEDAPMTPLAIPLSRRSFLASSVALGTLSVIGDARSAAAGGMLWRPIPSTGEQIPAIGMGSWITFNVGDDEGLRAQRLEVMKTFLAAGGTLLDSSPMYGSSEEVLGGCLKRLPEKPQTFRATKVWTMFQSWGVTQMQKSRELWGGERFDLIQIHNMRAVHL
jgi:diketogulonate reductase-like aldo/keto reductase